MRNERVPDRTGVWYHTFGCKANQYDTEHMRHELEARGAASVLEADEADVAVATTFATWALHVGRTTPPKFLWYPVTFC